MVYSVEKNFCIVKKKFQKAITSAEIKWNLAFALFQFSMQDFHIVKNYQKKISWKLIKHHIPPLICLVCVCKFPQSLHLFANDIRAICLFLQVCTPFSKWVQSNEEPSPERHYPSDLTRFCWRLWGSFSLKIGLVCLCASNFKVYIQYVLVIFFRSCMHFFLLSQR